MKKYLYDYINDLEKKLKNDIKKSDIDELINKINFFSHERLIHLIVTLFFALITLGFTIVCFNYSNYFLYCITLILYVMLLFYVVHYYYLENGVQYLYKVYDKMIKKINN